MELLTRVRELEPRAVVIMLTAQGSIESAVEAMRGGAYDYIPKPVDPARLRAVLQNANRQSEANANTEVEARRRAPGVLGGLVGPSPQMKAIFQMIERIAPSNVSVLVTGESGTGKELVARCLHDLSSRQSKPFVAVNCAAIPETLIESEIFGHEKGAFTGAIERRAGCFELAEEGTLLLDEIGEMPMATRSSCCACWKTASSAAWAARRKRPWTCAWWRRPTRTRSRRWPGTIARRSLLPPQRLQHPDASPARAYRRYSRHGREDDRRDEPEPWVFDRPGSRPACWTACLPTTGPATRASCATPLSARPSWRAGARSRSSICRLTSASRVTRPVRRPRPNLRLRRPHATTNAQFTWRWAPRWTKPSAN